MAKLVFGTDKTNSVTPAMVRNVTPSRYVEYSIDNNGKLIPTKDQKFLDFSGVEEISEYGFPYTYYNNTYNNIAYNIDLSDIKKVNRYGFYNTFYNCPGIRGSLDLSSLQNASDYSFYNAFRECGNITSVDLSGIETISGQNALGYTFYRNTGLTSIDFSSLRVCNGMWAIYCLCWECSNLTTVNLSKLEYLYYECLAYTFSGCTSLTNIDLSNLIVLVSTDPMGYTFQNCSALTSVDLSSLNTLSGAQQAMQYCFKNCTSLTSLSFPAITKNSFGTQYINQFYNMCSGIPNITIHFPSNVRSVVETLSSYDTLFGATNGTILFDLPATVELKGANNYRYVRQHKKDTATALAWYYSNTYATLYSSGLSTPAVGDTLYSDPECTTSVTTVSEVIS